MTDVGALQEGGITSGRECSIQTAEVVANKRLCREHYRLTLELEEFPGAGAGQFVHLSPEVDSPSGYRTFNCPSRAPREEWAAGCFAPMLRRAFSIAGLTRRPGGVHVDVIYRVVGAATRWMESLKIKSRLSVLGPLGNTLPISDRKPVAWLVAGGVGFPAMLWFAEALQKAGKRCTAFCGARAADLLPLSLEPRVPPSHDARNATFSCREFARVQVPVVISTDDGSLGFHGHIGAAMAAYHKANAVPSNELVVYTCGPQAMMRFVAGYSAARDIECYVCMERAVACGTGLCQSCVVAVHDESDPDGWSYRLCCTEGPVFDGARVIWEPVEQV